VEIWCNIIPHECKYGIICPIQKEGDEMMCDNYRVATLLCTTYKILANTLYVKLVHFAKEIMGEYEGGFQRRRPTVDQIFTDRQILGKC
jgi:hypothetical protein